MCVLGARGEGEEARLRTWRRGGGGRAVKTGDGGGRESGEAVTTAACPRLAVICSGTHTLLTLRLSHAQDGPGGGKQGEDKQLHHRLSGFPADHGPAEAAEHHLGPGQFLMARRISCLCPGAGGHPGQGGGLCDGDGETEDRVPETLPGDQGPPSLSQVPGTS